MARPVDREKFLKKIPEDFHKLLRKDEDFETINQMWKLDNGVLKTLFASIPDKLKPIFEWKMADKPVGKRGNKSSIPYSSEHIKLAQQLMKLSPGATIVSDDDISGSLLTVQVLVKMQVGDTIKTVSISNIKEIQ